MGFFVCALKFILTSFLVLLWVKIMAIVIAMVIIIITFLFLSSSVPPPLLFLQFSLLALLCLLTPSPPFLAYSSTSFFFSPLLLFFFFFCSPSLLPPASICFYLPLFPPSPFSLHFFVCFHFVPRFRESCYYVISVTALDIIFKRGN